jgi:hypothetical protein
MNCKQVQKQLPSSDASDALKSHIESCAECAQFAERLQTAQQLFRDHRSEFAPDAGFAARVSAQLPTVSTASLSWAAVRVLPVTLALLAVLAWFSWTVPTTSTELTSPTDDLLSWVIDSDGDLP